ncbi:hypothetical protein A1O7_07585 [Cladophialophora yegresii CBS 114405]|uniref:Zn(2)-C6 fungal-type domain-containing protein n=1 Tax=Cladophialophora yegresii CBS 114405 TaxID=1182544 RepID=W9VNW5_9EURO|nr:uncharacterized protein A1O7_07585 [Cladophialophora yegresii CBS 114405]EXJ57238.1 hypothetical protein A1O7_07585 [Cladophialophora yegresii CBS 114405]
MADERKNGGGAGGGCWTCRLRRKKCDEGRPRCRNCTLLEIPCHSGAVKPDWMDGGTKQRDMAQRIKAQVKRGADVRREKQTTTGQGTSTSTCSGEGGNFILESGRANGAPRLEDSDQRHAMRRPQVSTREANTARPPPRQIVGLNWTTSVLGFLDAYEEVTLDDDDHLPILARGRDFELDFLMKYLDYVFPHQFPFYRPSLHETGRSWVLALLRRSRAAFHSAMSLSAYFFTFTLIDPYPGQHDACKAQLWAKVGSQTDMCFKMIQRDIRALSDRGARATLVEKSQVMESIVQVLLFEVTLGRSANWNLHLTPALALFDQIWQSASFSTATELPGSKLLAVLDTMTLSLQFGLEHDGGGGGYVWSPEQAGFRFFTGLLVFIDIIASTALERAPWLSERHAHLLADRDRGVPVFGAVTVQLSGLVGCQNWVLLAVSQVTLLDVWKKEMKRTARLSMTELVDRASHIARTLHDGVYRLDQQQQQQQPTPSLRNDNPLDYRSFFESRPATSPTPSTNSTKIWAHAAQIYLAVVVSGWQPSNAEIRAGVARVLELLRTADCSTHLRTLAWPLCVAGCLSEAGSHEEQFRDLFTGMDELSMVGALGEARQVMEKVWEKRESVNHDTWDLAACFRILGAPVLLV